MTTGKPEDAGGAAVVISVSRCGERTFSKPPVDAISLVEGVGVEGDVHAGATMRHRSRMADEPDAPNIRQVHLIPAELLDEINALGFSAGPGSVGENVLTRGLALNDLPLGTRLRLGNDAVVELTGLRDPCRKLDRLQPGLTDALRARGEEVEIARRAGVMSVVIAGGTVRAGDAVAVRLPDAPHEPLKPV